jgi:hypothetical protein
VTQDTNPVATTVTDQSGNFSISGLRGGLHAVEAAGAVHLRRFWTAEAAPPAANLKAMLVTTHVTPEVPNEPEAPEVPVVEQPVADPAFVAPETTETTSGRWLTPYTATWIVLGLGIGGVVALSQSDDSSAS